MKKIFKFALAVACACGAMSADTLKIGTNANFPPFEYIDDSSNIVGFDIDLVNELTKRSGYDVEIVNMGFDGLIPALKSGKIDAAISGMSATEERKKAVDFTDPYFTTDNVYLKRKDDDSIKALEDIKEKPVGVQLGTVQEARAGEVTSKSNPFKDPIAAIMALKGGKVDAVILDTSVAYGYLKQNPDLVEFFKEPDGSDGFAIAFDKDKNPEAVGKFNEALKAMKDDGAYDKLLEKYEMKAQ